MIITSQLESAPTAMTSAVATSTPIRLTEGMNCQFSFSACSLMAAADPRPPGSSPKNAIFDQQRGAGHLSFRAQRLEDGRSVESVEFGHRYRADQDQKAAQKDETDNERDGCPHI